MRVLITGGAGFIGSHCFADVRPACDVPGYEPRAGFEDGPRQLAGSSVHHTTVLSGTIGAAIA